MDKRLFSVIPRPKVERRFYRLIKMVSQMTYLITASRQKIAGKDTLIVNFFRNDEEGLTPVFRTFCQEDNYISQELLTDKTVWKTGSIQFLIGSFYTYGRKMAIVTEYQNIIKNRKLQKKYAEEMAKIDEQMGKFGSFPDDYQEFVENTVFADENYIFYNRKKAKAFCTGCKHEFGLEKGRYASASGKKEGQFLKHNSSIQCRRYLYG